MNLKLPIDPEERRNFVRFVLRLGGLIVLCAVLHAEYLIRVEPRHYTEYHRRLLSLHSPTLLAAQYAAIASVGPGMVFGMICFFLCRAGRGRRILLRQIFPAVIGLILAIETLSLGAACLSRAIFRKSGAPLFPKALFPELSEGIVYTQSANLALLLVSPVLCTIFFLVLRRWRSLR